jgi:hypothetical protein
MDQNEINQHPEKQERPSKSRKKKDAPKGEMGNRVTIAEKKDKSNRRTTIEKKDSESQNQNGLKKQK